MDIRQRPPKPSIPHHRHQKPPLLPTPSFAAAKASDALPLPLNITNCFFFTLFFSVAYYLLERWRDKIRTSTPLHVLTFYELAAISSLIASFIYLLGFFGIDFVQSFISRSSHEAWELENDEKQIFIHDEDRDIHCPVPSLITNKPKSMDISVTPLPLKDDDEELVKSVVSGEIPSHSLESKLGDCFKAASIRRDAVQTARERGSAAALRAAIGGAGAAPAGDGVTLAAAEEVRTKMLSHSQAGKFRLGIKFNFSPILLHYAILVEALRGGAAASWA